MNNILEFTKRNQTIFIVVLIFLFVAIPRILSAPAGLPYLHFWDEDLLGLGAIIKAVMEQMLN